MRVYVQYATLPLAVEREHNKVEQQMNIVRSQKLIIDARASRNSLSLFLGLASCCLLLKSLKREYSISL